MVKKSAANKGNKAAAPEAPEAVTDANLLDMLQQLNAEDMAKVEAFVDQAETEVETERHTDRGAFMDALPYTVGALRRRRDVPTWIDLEKMG